MKKDFEENTENGIRTITKYYFNGNIKSIEQTDAEIFTPKGISKFFNDDGVLQCYSDHNIGETVVYNNDGKKMYEQKNNIGITYEKDGTLNNILLIGCEEINLHPITLEDGFICSTEIGIRIEKQEIENLLAAYIENFGDQLTKQSISPNYTLKKNK